MVVLYTILSVIEILGLSFLFIIIFTNIFERGIQKDKIRVIIATIMGAISGIKIPVAIAMETGYLGLRIALFILCFIYAIYAARILENSLDEEDDNSIATK